MSRLVLVRHAMPDVDPLVPPERWELGTSGRSAASAMAPTLPSPRYVVSSDEPKALATAAALGDVPAPDVRLREVSRDEPFDGDFRARRRGYVEGADRPGWESRAAVVQRVGDALAAGLAVARERDATLVAVGHGMAFTVWLADAIGLADPGAFWADLRLPDAWAVDLGARTAIRLARGTGAGFWIAPDAV